MPLDRYGYSAGGSQGTLTSLGLTKKTKKRKPNPASRLEQAALLTESAGTSRGTLADKATDRGPLGAATAPGVPTRKKKKKSDALSPQSNTTIT